MSQERTLVMIKPDALRHERDIIQMVEARGLSVIARTNILWEPEQAKAFYGAEHEGREYFPRLIDHMSSGPMVALVLEGENAIKSFRELLGSTDASKASAGTIRARFGSGGSANAAHGSDSPEAAAREIAFFYPGLSPQASAPAPRPKGP